MKVKVKDVKANPYRNIDHYPLNKEKIMALTSSIEKTGFWDNLVGRKMNGEIQIAYGHHRIEALRLAKGYGYDFEFDLPIRDIEDGAMIQIMANENMQEWGHSMVVIDETVKVAKKYLENDDVFCAGKIRYHKKTRNDYKGKASAKDIAEFLGWGEKKVFQSLQRINSINSGEVSKKAIEKFKIEKSKYFLKSIKGKGFTHKEQEKIADELVRNDISRDKIKGIINEKAFEKKYPNAGNKEKKTDSRVIDFAHKLIEISESLDATILNVNALKEMHKEIKNISGIKYSNVRILFISVAELQRSINQFLEVMSEDTELTEENINNLKQLTK